MYGLAIGFGVLAAAGWGVVLYTYARVASIEDSNAAGTDDCQRAFVKAGGVGQTAQQAKGTCSAITTSLCAYDAQRQKCVLEKPENTISLRNLRSPAIKVSIGLTAAAAVALLVAVVKPRNR